MSRTKDSGEGVMSAGCRVVDGRRLEANRSSNVGWTVHGYAVCLAVDGGTWNRRPADGVEAWMIQAEHVTLTQPNVLVRVEVDVDVAQLCGTNERL